MSFKQVWQCGHCGSVSEDKVSVEECCCGMEEEAWQCENCQTPSIVFNEQPNTKCKECGE